MARLKNPLISIGIPTYNRADAFLKDAIESALNQTYPNIEIIVADNSSTDHTDEIVKSYPSEKIQYYKHDENIGANNNFNFCLNQARGDYFLLLHDDDLIDDDFVETCMAGIEDKPETGVIRTGVRIIDKEGKEQTSSFNSVNANSIEGFIDQWLNKSKTSLYMCSVLYNRRGLQEIGGFNSPEDLYQDVVAELKLTEKLGRVDLYPVKASFRRHEENRGSKSAIYRWAVDSKYVSSLIDDYIDNEELKKIAKYKLSKWNYYRANRISSFHDRLYSYFINYKIFDFQFSPMFILRKELSQLIRKAG